METRPTLAPLEELEAPRADADNIDKGTLLARIRERSRGIAFGAAAGAAALALSGCGSGMTEGRVVEKKIEPERTWVMLIPIRTGQVCSGTKVVTCTPIYTVMPIFHHDDQDWVLKLEDCSQGGECRYGKVYVSEAAYLATKVGDHYVKSEIDSLDDDIAKRKATRQERRQAKAEQSVGVGD